jgi:hypothetical protein
VQRQHRRPTKRHRQPNASWGLYWVTTDDHHEDWFIVATRPGAAERFHERSEGYLGGDAYAELVAGVPEGLEPSTRGAQYPTRELLEGCGAQILRWDTPRAVRMGRHVFVEGGLEYEILILTDDQAERQGKGRPNRTERRGRPS